KIFNADWVIDGKKQPHTLFGMIRETHAANPQGTVLAYADNAAIIEGAAAQDFFPGEDNVYRARPQTTHFVAKCETHNHPTAISPFPGAATGAGGEIRDEGATGRGAKPKAGLVGYSVSNLQIPGAMRPWEAAGFGRPGRIVSPLQIMIDGPIGAADSPRRLPYLRAEGQRRGARLSQADHAGRRRGEHRRRELPEARIC